MQLQRKEKTLEESLVLVRELTGISSSRMVYIACGLEIFLLLSKIKNCLPATCTEIIHTSCTSIDLMLGLV